MYHAIVKRNLLRSFDALNRGEYEVITGQFHPRATHWFSGDGHPLSGLRRGRPDMLAWYDRLARLMPDLRFDIAHTAISGWPWDTVAMLSWRDALHDRAGKAYANRGVHVIHIRWGKVVDLQVYCDTAYLQGYFDALVAQGVEEAQAPPIVTE